jgi:Na+-driven multidrug efflux pump
VPLEIGAMWMLMRDLVLLRVCSLAAMNPSTSMYNFVFMVVTYALAPAVTSLVTAALGKAKPARAGAAIRNALLLSVVGGCALAAAMQAAFPALLQAMGCGADALPAAVAYSSGRGWVRASVCLCAPSLYRTLRRRLALERPWAGGKLYSPHHLARRP